MSEYSIEDFKNMKFDISDLEEGDSILARFPMLRNYKEFNAPIDDIDRVLKWIFLCYDRGSPFLREVNINQRKLKAASYVGFERQEDGRFLPDIEDILKGKNNDVNVMVIRFAWLFNNPLYALLVAKLEFLYKFTVRMATDMKMTAKEANEADEIVATITKISDELFMQDTNINLKDDLFQHIEQEKIEFSPEHIALKIKEDKPVVKLRGRPKKQK